MTARKESEKGQEGDEAKRERGEEKEMERESGALKGKGLILMAKE